MTTEEWEDLILTSHYLANIEIKNQLEKGNYEQVKIGLEMLTEEQKDCHQTDLLWQLRDLMFHILSGILVPQKRTAKWDARLFRLRCDFQLAQRDLDILNDEYVQSIWEEAFENAEELAEVLVRGKKVIPHLTWEEVFEKEYLIRPLKK